MTRLAELTAASRRVSDTTSRLDKVRELARCLRAVAPDEVPIAIAYLSGETCQGKLGVSHATLRDAVSERPAAEPSLTLAEVDRAFAALAAIKGKGSAGQRAAALQALFTRAT